MYIRLFPNHLYPQIRHAGRGDGQPRADALHCTRGAKAAPFTAEGRQDLFLTGVTCQTEKPVRHDATAYLASTTRLHWRNWNCITPMDRAVVLGHDHGAARDRGPQALDLDHASLHELRTPNPVQETRSFPSNRPWRRPLY